MVPIKKKMNPEASISKKIVKSVSAKVPISTMRKKDTERETTSTTLQV